MNTQTSEEAQTFMDALKTLESEKDTGPIVALFSNEATLERLTHKTYQGKADTETFWREYLEPFERINTEFVNVTENGQSVVLEWESKGILVGGREISYKGVSSLDLTDGRVANFRTYYDSAVFVPERDGH